VTAIKAAKAIFAASVIVFLATLAWDMAGLDQLPAVFVIGGVSAAGIVLSATAWVMIWLIAKTSN
jgi:hypothetical protein